MSTVKRRAVQNLVSKAVSQELTVISASHKILKVLEMTLEEEQDLDKLLKLRNELREHGLKSSYSIWMYDHLYLPLNNMLAEKGLTQHDDGHL